MAAAGDSERSPLHLHKDPGAQWLPLFFRLLWHIGCGRLVLSKVLFLMGEMFPLPHAPHFLSAPEARVCVYTLLVCILVKHVLLCWKPVF